MNVKTNFMTSRFAILALLLSVASSCTSQIGNGRSQDLPPTVTRVETFNIDEHIVRVTLHNMELEPKVGIELLKTPRLQLLDSEVLTQITLNGETLSFAESSGAFVESVEPLANGITIVFDYFYLRGGSDLIRCQVPIQAEAIGNSECQVE